MVGPERPQFVLFGSSIVEMSFGAGLGVAGWGAILADLYARQDLCMYWCGPRMIRASHPCEYKADIVLRGYGGWNSKRGLEILEQVFPKDAAVQPSLVIVYFGGNDSVDPHPSGLGPHVPLNEFVENMKKIATYLMSLSEKTRLIFLTTPPFNEEQYRRVQEYLGNNNRVCGRSNEACGMYSEACVKLCQEMGIKVIDLWTEIQKKNDWQTTCFIDGIHFSSEGSKIVAKEILKVLRDADWEPSLYLTSLPSEFGEDSPYDPVNIDGNTTINYSKLWAKTSFFKELSNQN